MEISGKGVQLKKIKILESCKGQAKVSGMVQNLLGM